MSAESPIYQNPKGGIKERLLAKKIYLEAHIEGIRRRSLSLAEMDRSAEMGDNALESELRDDAVALEISSLATLAQINWKLEKVEKGTAGQCDICKSDIEKAREEALPMTTVCASCAPNSNTGPKAIPVIRLAA